MEPVQTRIVPARGLKQWLFNPFNFIAGSQALLLGLAIILLSAALGFLGTTHFDGTLDVHVGASAPFWFFILEVLIDWLSLALPLYLFALIFSKSSFRAIDLFGTQALARWPYLIIALLMLAPAVQRVNQYFLSLAGLAPRQPELNYLDILVAGFAFILSFAMIVWTVALMYKAYVVSCNLKGTRAVVTFVLAIVIAEISSKIIIAHLAGIANLTPSNTSNFPIFS